MRIVNTTSVFPECSDSFEVLERLARAGYEGIDLAFDYCVQNKDFPFMTDGYEDWAYRLRDRAEELVFRSHTAMLLLTLLYGASLWTEPFAVP